MNIILCFDNDEAGRKATERAATALEEYKSKVLNRARICPLYWNVRMASSLAMREGLTELSDELLETENFLANRTDVKLAEEEFVEEYLTTIESLQSNLANLQTDYYQADHDDQRMLLSILIEQVEEKLLKKQKQEEWAKTSKKKGASQLIPLEQVRDYPITAILDAHSIVRIKTGHNRERIICPGHNEKTASCVIYTDQNSFYCYSCNAGGSCIDMLALVDNCSSTEAIKKLRGILSVNSGS